MCLGLRDILHFSQGGRTPISGLDHWRAHRPHQRMLQRVQRRVPQLGPREVEGQLISHRRVMMVHEPRLDDRQIARLACDELVGCRDRASVAPTRVDLGQRTLTAARGGGHRRSL